MILRNKYAIGIVLLGVVALALLGYFTYANAQENKRTFQQDGYFLRETLREDTDETVVEQVSFRSGDRYRYKYPGKIVFEDVQRKPVFLEQDSFIHYSDGSIGAATNGVVLNLADESTSLNYYSIPPNTVVEKSGDGYTVDHMGKPIEFNQFIWKLSPDKYGLVGKDIKLQNGEIIKDFQDFVEIRYVDDGIIQMMGNDDVLLTVSSNAKLTVNGADVDFTKKQIHLPGNMNIPLSRMVIDAEDNIEVASVPEQSQQIFKLPKFPTFKAIDGEEGKAGEDGNPGEAGVAGDPGDLGEEGLVGDPGEEGTAGQEGTAGSEGVEGDEGGIGTEGGSGTEGGAGTAGKEGQEGTSGSEGSSGSTGSSGAAGGAGRKGSDGKTIDPNENDPNKPDVGKRILTPEIYLSQWVVTPNGVEGDIEIIDKETRMVLNDENPLRLLVIDAVTGAEVASYDHIGGNTFSFELGGLQMNRNYQFLVKGKYTVDDVVYQKNFLDKMFRTDEVGLTLRTELLGADSFNIKVLKSSYSSVTRGMLTIFDMTTGEEVGSVPLNMGTEEIYAFDRYTIDGLRSNTEYEAKLTNVEIESGENIQTIDVYEPGIRFKTLKQKPTGIQPPNVVIDKRNEAFHLSLSAVPNDLDQGITAYRYEIYDATTNQLVATMNKNDLSEGVFPFKNFTTLNRGYNYYAKLIVEFYDNEKTVEVESDKTTSFQLSSAGFPIIRVDNEETGFNYLKGNLVINPNGTAISISNGTPLKLNFTNSVGSTFTRQYTALTAVGGNYIINLDENNLRQTDSYVMNITATVDLYDGNGPQEISIGTHIFNTTKSAPMAVVFSATESLDHAIQMEMFMTTSGEREKDYLDQLVLELYAGDEARLQGTAIISNQQVENPGNSTLKQYFDSNNKLVITEETFGLHASQLLESTYSIKVKQASNQTRHLMPASQTDYYQNLFEVTYNKVPIVKYEGPPPLPTQNNALIVVPITKAKATTDYGIDVTQAQFATLPSTAIIGYYVKPNYGEEPVKLAQEFTVNAMKVKTTLKTQDATLTTAEVAASEQLGSYVLDVKSAVVPGLILIFGTGTNSETSKDYTVYTDTMGRGYQYFFTYSAKLNYNEVESDYPQAGQGPLYSVVQDAPRIDPVIQAYPSKSDVGKMIYKFKITDLDNVIYENKMTYGTTGNENTVTPLQKDNIYHDVTFTGLADGQKYTSMYQKEKYDFTEYTTLTDVPLASFLFTEKKNFNASGKYRVIEQLSGTDLNGYYFTIDGLTPQQSKEVAGLEIVVTEATLGTRTLKLPYEEKTIGGNNIYASLMPLSALGSAYQGKTVHFAVSAYYDSGLSGYEYANIGSELSAIQVSAGASAASYLGMNSSGVQSIRNSASESVFNLGVLNPNAGIYTVTSAMYGKSTNFPITVDKGGITLSNNYVIPKKIEKQAVNPTSASDDNKTIGIIKPQMTLDAKDITTTTSTAYIKKVSVFGANAINDPERKVHVELFDANKISIDPDVAWFELLPSLDEQDITFDISSLLNNTTYYVKFYVKIDGNKIYLNDSYTTKDEFYRLQTMSNVAIGGVGGGVESSTVKYIADSYYQKRLEMTYTLSSDRGFQMYYKFEKMKLNTTEVIDEIDDATLQSLGLLSKVPLSKTMVQSLRANPGDWFEPGYDYRVTMTAAQTVNSTFNVVGTMIDTFRFQPLRTPNYGITAKLYKSSDGTDYGFDIQLATVDTDKVVINGNYKVRVYDAETGFDITPDQYKGVYNVDSITQNFSIRGLGSDKLYYIRIYAIRNVENQNITQGIETVAEALLPLHLKKEATVKTISESGISLDKIQVAMTADSKFALQFIDSVGLDKITTLSYSYLYNSTASASQTVAFVPVNKGSYYEFILPGTITGTGRYNLMLQFMIDDTTIIAERQVDYIKN